MSMIFQLTTALQDIYINLFVAVQAHKHSHFDPSLTCAVPVETFAQTESYWL